MSKTHGSRGDTIVEVLIALAVLTTILVGAYVTASRSQNTNQASQERSEATKIAESQIERLKGWLASGKTVPGANSFCILDNNSSAPIITNPSDPFAEPLESATLPYETAMSSTECGDKEGRYNVAIRKTVVDANTNTYEFRVRWNKIGGGNDQINMFYRTY